jgi:lysozyme family protein
MGVLFGVGEAVEILQRILAVPWDGNFGPMTLQAVNTAAGSLLVSYKTAMKQRAYEIVALHPSEVVFEAGWAARIDS